MYLIVISLKSQSNKNNLNFGVECRPLKTLRVDAKQINIVVNVILPLPTKYKTFTFWAHAFISVVLLVKGKEK